MDHVTRAAILMFGPEVLQSYFDVFSEAAKKHNAWIVAGSSFIPEIEIPKLLPSSECPRIAKRYQAANVSFSFSPDGQLVDVTKKAFPIKDESFICYAEPEAAHHFQTPFGSPKDILSDDNVPFPYLDANIFVGRVAVLICADSWYPATYAALKATGVDVICVPAFNSPAQTWLAPWEGYDCALKNQGTPDDVDKSDIKSNVLLRDMWFKYSLKGRMKTAGAKIGIMSYLVGSVYVILSLFSVLYLEFMVSLPNRWEMTGSGQSYIVAEDTVVARCENHLEDDVLVYKIEN
jgi:hypothetical protein